MKNYYIQIKKVQDEECEDSLSSVIERYSPVFLSMYSRFISSIKQSGAAPSDILEDKDMIIYEAIKSFNKDKGVSFCTWLSNITKYKCLHLMNKSRKQCALKERYKNKIYTDDNLLQVYADTDGGTQWITLLRAGTADDMTKLDGGSF